MFRSFVTYSQEVIVFFSEENALHKTGLMGCIVFAMECRVI